MARLVFTGDVMTGRGIDQILATPSDPAIPDPRTRTAVDFVRWAEARNGEIPRRTESSYIWGEAPALLGSLGPSLRIGNLETAITTSASPEAKSITYRMHPANAGVLRALPIDCCSLANNHVLDWGREGLLETLDALDRISIARTGAGRNLHEAWQPARLPMPEGGHALVFGFAHGSSGIPQSWAAGPGLPGVALLGPGLRDGFARVAEVVRRNKGPRDVAVASIHWGANWGYGVQEGQIAFARALVEGAGIDIVHGHSSHHPMPIGFCNGRPVLYGCGDFMNDYEGIGGHEDYRPSLVAAYVIDTEDMAAVTLLPFHLRRFQLVRAGREDCLWLARRLSRHSLSLGARFEAGPDGWKIRCRQSPGRPEAFRKA